MFLLLVQEDLRYPCSWIQDIVWTYLNKYVDPMFNVWTFNKLREISLRNLMKHIYYEDENTKYIGLCPINKVIWSELFFSLQRKCFGITLYVSIM